MTKWTFDVTGKGYPLAFECIVTTATDTTHFSATSMIGWGDDYFKGYYAYIVWDAGGSGAAPQGEYKVISSYTSTTGAFTHSAFTTTLSLTDKVLIIHPSIANALDVYTDWADGGRLDNILDAVALASVLGALGNTAATGAPDSGDTAMSLIKQLVNGLGLDGSSAYTHDYSKTTVAGWLHGFHAVRRILFVVPETLTDGGPTNDHNIAIKAELDAIGLVKTITQTDAIMYPDYESISLVVLGSPLTGTAWTTSNLEDIRSVFGLPVLCVDGEVAEYLKMGTDGTNASSKTILRAITNIKASILGIGQDNDTGLAVGVNTVAASGVTFATLDMSDSDITEVWYAYENDNNNTDVLVGEIRQSMPDGTVGVDADGFEVPGTLAFYGCAYSMNGLNTLGKAVFHLYVEKLTHSSTAGLAVLLSGNVGSLVNTIGNKKTATATGAVGTGTKMMGYVKQLVTALILVLADTADMQPKLGTPADTSISKDLLDIKAVVDAITAITGNLPNSGALTDLLSTLGAITAAGPTNTQMETARDAIIAAIPAMVGTDGAATVGDGWDSDLATILDNFTSTRIGYLDQLDFGLQEAIAAIKGILDTPANFMANVASLALEGTLGTHDTDIKALLATIIGYIDNEIGDLATAIAAVPTATEIQTEMEQGGASILDALRDGLTDARMGFLDELADANLPTDVANVKTDTGNIKTQTDKLAGASPAVGTATETWNAAEADIVSIGANNTKNKLHSLVLDISGLTAAATITIRMYMQVNGNEKKVYDQDFVVGTDPDGLWMVNGMVGIHEVLRVTAESDDATDNGLDIEYDYMLEVM